MTVVGRVAVAVIACRSVLCILLTGRYSKKQRYDCRGSDGQLLVQLFTTLADKREAAL